MNISSFLLVYVCSTWLSIFIFSQPYYSIKNTYFLQDTLSSLPCSLLSTSPPPISAAEIFQKLTLPVSTTLQSIMITAWVLLQGYEQRYYTILSVHDMGLASVFSLSYQSNINTINTQFKTKSDTDGIVFLNLQQWIFIKLQITLASAIPSIDNVYLLIQNHSYPAFEKNINYSNQPGDIVTFSSQTLFNIGFSADGLTNYPPGCACIQHVTLYLDPQPTLDSLVSPMHRKQSVDTHLLWHYDFHYSITNPGKIFSVGANQDILDAPQMVNNEILPSDFITTQLMDIEQNSGFIVYLEFLFTATLTHYNNLLTIQSESGQKYSIYESGGIGIQLYFNGYSLCNFLENKWYAIVLIIDNLATKQGFSKVKDCSDWVVSPLYVQMQSVTFIFGGQNNKAKLEMDNIRIYTGTFVASDAECLLSTGIKSYNCLFCQPGYDLSYQAGMTCVAQTSPIKVPTEKDGIQDWARSPCPPEQIRMSPTYQCQCRLGFYSSDSSCVACPSFCKTCSDSKTCIEKDPLRDNVTGNCSFSSFDDGYLCIKSIYKIPNKKNLFKNYVGLTSSNSADFIIQPNDLKLQGNSSFFISFFIIQLDQVTVNQEQILAYLRDQNQDVFTISIKKIYNTLPSMITYSCCFYSKTTLLKCLSVSQTSIWIGFWADLQSVVMAIQNSGGVYYEVVNVISDPYIYPSLCVGYCQSLDATKSIFQGGFPSSTTPNHAQIPIWYILGMTNPKDRISDLFSFAQSPSKMILYFKPDIRALILGFYFFSNCSEDPNYQETQMVSSRVDIDALKGLQIIPHKAFSIPGGLKHNQTTAFSMNIFINSMGKEKYNIGEINSGTQVVNYYIMSQISLNISYVRICLQIICKQTTYAVLLLHQQNFLAIIQRIVHPNASSFFVYEFEVVCNYKREKILFLNQGTMDLNSFQYSSPDSSDPHDIYLNNLKFFSGGNFYFDYTSEDPCFLYYDTADMKCIQPKQGFAMMNSLVIPSTECINQKSSKGTMIIFNKYTNECYETKYINPSCAEINEDLVSCFKCKDPNADPALNCSCPEGTYLDKNSNTCCHTKCSKCSGDASTCTECKYPRQFLPDCQCILPNQYQDTISFECKTCDNQCDTCQGSAADCIECSQGRITPPQCECDARYYDKSHSNNDICYDYDCEQQCETCEYTQFTCVTCSVGRVNSPHCRCDVGYYEQINGNNKLCLQCPSHEFYDSSTKFCLPCDFTCKECETSSNICTQCQDDLVLYNQKCLCSDLSSFTLSSTGEILCYSGMGVSLKIESRNSRITLVFSFEENLALIDFEAHPIDTIIYMFISGIAAENYSLKEPTIEGNKLIVKMSFTQTFSASQGNAIFLPNDCVFSSSTKHFLDRKYLETPLMFQIGPLLIADDLWQPNQQTQETTNTLKSFNSSIAMQLIKQSSIIFYVLNTLQPCVAFILTKIVIPPNLYQTLQIIALLTFPNVEDYGVVPKDYQTQLFLLELKNSSDISMNQMGIFRRVSYSNCMLVNIPIAVAQILVVPCIYGMFLVIEKVALSSKISSFCQKTSSFLQSQIYSNIETSLFLLSTAILNQFYNIDQTQYFNRMSVYLSIIVSSFIVTFYYQIYRHLGFLALPVNQSKFQQFQQFPQQKVYLLLVNQLDFCNRPRKCKCYYFIQVAKKYLLCIFLVALQNYPRVSFAGCAGVFGASLIISLWIRPYKTKIDNACKILGDACLFTSWIIFLLQFVPFQSYFQIEQQIPKEKVEKFLLYGTIIIGLLAAFNIIFCLQFIQSKIVIKIIKLFKPKSNTVTPSVVKEEANHDFLKYNQNYLQSLDPSSLLKTQQDTQQSQFQLGRAFNKQIAS